jgi:Ser/Thr protein kinase RdoA (MazF antagonist)
MIPEARVAQPVTQSEAAQLARKIFSLDVSAKSLPGEYDDNFHLTSADGHEFVLKVMHPAREQSFVEMQCQALQHLAKRAAHLSLPRVYATSSGENFTLATLEGGTKRLLWLLTYVSGTVLAEVNPHSQDLLGSLGRFLGEMDAALADFSHPATHRELKWDLPAPRGSETICGTSEIRSGAPRPSGFLGSTNRKWFPHCLRCAAASSMATPMITTCW